MMFVDKLSHFRERLKYDLVKQTGCQPNCNRYIYKKYKEEDFYHNDGISKFYKPSNCSTTLTVLVFKFKWLDNELKQETEKYSYNELTLLANFGGALGLFVGFSFFMLWDFFMIVIDFVKALKFFEYYSSHF